MPRKQHEVIVASAPRKRIIGLSSKTTTNITAGSSESILIYSAPNTISKVIGMYLNVVSPALSTVGTHYLFLGTSGSVAIDYIRGESVFNKTIGFNVSGFDANTTPLPSGNTEQLMTLGNIHFDENNPLRISYKNNTDVVQSNARDFRFWVLEETLG
jgi:hypothetical protein